MKERRREGGREERGSSPANGTVSGKDISEAEKNYVLLHLAAEGGEDSMSVNPFSIPLLSKTFLCKGSSSNGLPRLDTSS